MATTEDTAGLDSRPEREELRSTISGLPVEPLYSPENVEIDYERDLGAPGEFPFTRGVYPSMYRGRLWTMRQFAGFGTAAETNERFRYLLEHGQTGLSTAFDMPTLMGYDSDHPRVAGRGRPRGGGDRLARGHGDPVRGDPARRGLDLDDDQLAGGDPARVLRLRRRRAGRPARPAPGDGADRHPQGVHRAEGVHLPARAVDAAGGGHDRVVRGRAAADAPGLDLRLPHPRGRLDRGAGAGLHAGGRVRLRRGGDRAGPGRGRVRAAAVVLLQRAHRLLRGDRQVPGGAPDLGARAARPLRREEPALVADALPHADRRRLADGAAAAREHRPHRDRGARRRARRDAVAAHELVRRGARAADARRRCCSRSARSR